MKDTENSPEVVLESTDLFSDLVLVLEDYFSNVDVQTGEHIDAAKKVMELIDKSPHIVEKRYVRACIASAASVLSIDVNGIHPHAGSC